MFGEDFDRTLPATRRRREQSRQQGYVVQSRILATGVLLILLGMTWGLFGRNVMQSLVSYFQQSFGEWSALESGTVSLAAVLRSMQPLLEAVAMWSLVLLLGAALAVGLQTRGWFAPRFVLPHMSRVSPFTNIRRLFGSLGTRVSSAVLSIAVSLLLVWSVWWQIESGETLSTTGSARSTSIAWMKALETTTFQVGAGCLAFGLLDLFMRHRRRESQLQMTPVEWEEEQRSATRGPS